MVPRVTTRGQAEVHQPEGDSLVELHLHDDRAVPGGVGPWGGGGTPGDITTRVGQTYHTVIVTPALLRGGYWNEK